MKVNVLTQRTLRLFSIPILAFVLLALMLALMLYAPAQAADGQKPGAGTFPLIIGTSLNPIGTNHDVYEVDPVGGTSQSLIPNFPVGGATYDAANDRILFTSSSGSTNIDQLWELPVGGATNNLGQLTQSTGAPLRMDGLAMSGGVLYGSLAEGTSRDGLWTIDTGTLVGTQVYPFSNSISGIDADPDTGVIYGVNDTTGQVVSIDPAGSMSNVTAYPAGQSDIDGLAAGNGRLYLVTDEPGSIYIYNLGTASYETPISNPWTSADTFSGAAYIAPSGPPAAPGIAIDKAPISQTVVTNGNANFTITVTNTGNVALANVTVSDPLVSACDNAIGTLAVSGTVSFGCQDTGVTASYTNVVTVTGVYTGGQVTVTDTASALVNVTSPTSVDLSGFSGNGEASVLPFIALLVVLAGFGALIYRRRVA